MEFSAASFDAIYAVGRMLSATMLPSAHRGKLALMMASCKYAYFVHAIFHDDAGSYIYGHECLDFDIVGDGAA